MERHVMISENDVVVNKGILKEILSAIFTGGASFGLDQAKSLGEGNTTITDLIKKRNEASTDTAKEVFTKVLKIEYE